MTKVCYQGRKGSLPWSKTDNLIARIQERYLSAKDYMLSYTSLLMGKAGYYHLKIEYFCLKMVKSDAK